MLMRNHGILTVGRTPGEAFMLLYYFERAARIQLDLQASVAAGTELVIPPHDVCEKAAVSSGRARATSSLPANANGRHSCASSTGQAPITGSKPGAY